MKYSVDWFSQHKPVWLAVLKDFIGKPIKVIEIGSFEGMATSWLCENILTHKESKIDCVDPYLPYLPDYKPMIDMVKAKETFFENTKEYKDKITLHETTSDKYLKQRTEMADLIYIDGDHSSKATLTDAIQSHLLLNPNGILIFDDYLWAGMLEGIDVPKSAINAFMTCFAMDYNLISIGYQIILQKKMV